MIMKSYKDGISGKLQFLQGVFYTASCGIIYFIYKKNNLEYY